MIKKFNEYFLEVYNSEQAKWHTDTKSHYPTATAIYSSERLVLLSSHYHSEGWLHYGWSFDLQLLLITFSNIIPVHDVTVLNHITSSHHKD